jgi:predicted CopG family antitoxin
MTSKTISVSEDAYELLMKMKLNGESFTETIRRLAKRRRLADCAGLWSDVSDKEIGTYLENIDELRQRASKSLESKQLESC